MSLNGALHLGRTALAASQTALQVAGNNMANAATEGYARRSVHLTPLRGEPLGNGNFLGRGVRLAQIRREVDTALQARHRDALGEESAALVDQRFLTSIETLQNELTDNDVSSLLSDFFNSFSELANSPSDNAVRAVVIEQGGSIASRLADLQRDYTVVLDEVDRSLGAAEEAVNDILEEIARLNMEIATTESGLGEANALRDQRDRKIDELAEYIDVYVVEQASGNADIFVNSIPIVLAGESRGIEMRSESKAGKLEVTVRVAADGTQLDARTGTIGGLLRQRDELVTPILDSLNEFAGQLIFEVNRLHAQGQGKELFGSVAGTYAFRDTSANMNSLDANIPFRIENGSFQIHVTHKDTGQRTSYQINVDGDAMSLDDLVNEINVVVGIPNATAGINGERAFTLTADAGYELSFAEDSSGALAALGVNTFFVGSSAVDIDVHQLLKSNPNLLAAGADHVPGSNGTARALADLQDVAVDGLGNVSMREYWQNSVNQLAASTRAASAAVESAALVRESLAAQIQGVSGVSLDEESINLLTFQRQFQAAARFITVIDETLQLLLSLG
jgi:flagellar hook-associated protein 1 FlgK